MKQSLTTNQAADILRADEYANWSYVGACALVEYLDELAEACGQELELDPVAIRCDFSEYASLIEWASSYWGGFLPDWDVMDEDQISDRIREHIQERGTLIEFDGGVIVSEF